MTRKVILFFLFYCNTALATPFGLNFLYSAAGKDPDNIHGYRGALFYQPPSLIWEKTQVYFDLGYGHWWVSGNDVPHRSTNIFSLAPYLRYYLIRKYFFSPYVEVSIGLCYLSRTRLNDRNLGTHFCLQDYVGIGSTFGKCQQPFYVTLGALHYSNAGTCKNNAGITIPLALVLGYRF